MKRLFCGVFCLLTITCGTKPETQKPSQIVDQAPAKENFVVQADRFADLQVLRYQVPGFEELTLNEKKLLYFLSQAAYSGRDIIWDQNYRHNLKIRRLLEAIVRNTQDDSDAYKKFMVYTKRVWFSGGIHHHYSTSKIMPEFTFEDLTKWASTCPEDELPLADGQSIDDLLTLLEPIMFDPDVDPKRVNLNPEADLVADSANNYYGSDVTQAEVEAFYNAKKDPENKTPVSHGLNSQLVKKDGELVERVWKVGGMYGEAIEQIVYWLEKASAVAENDKQRKALDLLVEYYKTGDLATFDAYNIAWVADTDSRIDVVNGFIEVYGDAMGYRGAYESVVSMKDLEATKRIQAISEQAQWFEDNAPLMDEHKKEKVTGISAKVITVVAESGDASPSTPIGINLPNSSWIRADHGSKSVNLGNIVGAYNVAGQNSGALEEFAFSQEEIDLAKEYGALASDLHTDMHEVIGHASGKLNEGVGTTKETLKNYASTLEEARADLVALYYIMDPKLIEIGVMPNLDVGKVEYNSYIRNGLMSQLRRLKLGEHLEESHMRNRQLVAQRAFEKGAAENVIEQVKKDGKTYFVVRDYDKLRTLFGDLLREIQRIKSEGDFEAGKSLVENYGVKVDYDLHKEVLERYAKLDLAPYSGFINPVLKAVTEGDQIVDVKISYPTDFTQQMLEYAEHYSFLPNEN